MQDAIQGQIGNVPPFLMPPFKYHTNMFVFPPTTRDQFILPYVMTFPQYPPLGNALPSSA